MSIPSSAENHVPIMGPERPSSQNDTSTKVKEQPQAPVAHAPSWAGRVVGACLHHLTRPATAGPLLFTCLCLAMAYKNRRKWGPKEAAAAPRPRPMLNRSVSMAALHGGKLALQRIMDSQEARIDQTTLENAVRSFQNSLEEEPLSFSKLQKTAAQLEMSGKEDEAVEILQREVEKAEKTGKNHEGYELEMLLVEMLIYKGKYEDALKRKCLSDKEISDARGPLYKAVIYLILGDISRAKESYEEFQDIRNRFHWPDGVKEGSPLYGVVHDFQVFETIVSNMKREIEHAHKAKEDYKDKANA